MVSGFINDPKHWHQRAEEMRAMAEGLADVQVKATMLRIAADYEKLAERAARRSDGTNMSAAKTP